MQTQTNENKQTKKEFPSIYVACLASYNSGVLHGKWIVPANNVVELQKQIDEVLEASPVPNADEYAIHDYDNFPNLSEYPSLEKIVQTQVAIEAHGVEVVKGFIEIFGDHNDLDKIDEAFYGTYDSFQQFAEQYADETMLIDCPDHLTHYIDYKAIERDLSYDYASYDTNDYQTLIFNKNW
jgi:antirestriction protein